VNLRQITTAAGAWVIVACFVSPRSSTPQQKFDKYKEQQGIMMLDEVHAEVKKHYYDPKFHGTNVDKTFADAKEKMKGIDSLNRDFGIIADALDSLQDSHTYFLPPPRPYQLDYGFRERMVGDKCIVTDVDPEAAKQGLRRGDQLLAINDHPAVRDTLWKLQYLYNTLSPQPALMLDVLGLNGERRRLPIKAEINYYNKQESPAINIGLSLAEQRIEKPRYKEYGDLLIVNLQTFSMEQVEADNLVSMIRRHKALILDMRGNGGGAVPVMEQLLNALFDHKVHIADRVTKEGRKPGDIKGTGDHAFSGKIVAIVDSQSASASEVTSRVLQLEKRATVIGDLSSGKVMETRFYGEELSVTGQFGFGVAVTEADLIMSDDKSLESVGVTPDEVSLPTAADVAAFRDPVLSRAAALLGVTLSPEEAGKLFPYIWLRLGEFRSMGT
jgi:C-terminal processing protease CtpA/Prc